MYTENFTDLSIVRLNDGRTGTVVHIHPNSNAAIIEIDSTNELITVTTDNVKEVIWKP